jgi:hypothetical protein
VGGAALGAQFGGDAVAAGDDGAALGGGERGAVGVADLVGVPVRQQAMMRMSRVVEMWQSAELWCLPQVTMSRW